MSFSLSLSSSDDDAGEEEDLETWARREGYYHDGEETAATTAATAPGMQSTKVSIAAASAASSSLSQRAGLGSNNDGAAPAASVITPDAQSMNGSNLHNTNNDDNDDAGDDDDSSASEDVDWEDVDGGEVEEPVSASKASSSEKEANKTHADATNSRTAAAAASAAASASSLDRLRPVTIQLKDREDGDDDNDDSNDTATNSGNKKQKSKRKRKRRHFFRRDELGWDVQVLLTELAHTHLLALTSSATIQSAQCSAALVSAATDDGTGSSDVSVAVLLTHLAYSLLPAEWTAGNTVIPSASSSASQQRYPTMERVRAFSGWFYENVCRLEQRRQQQIARNRAAGAPVAGAQTNNNSNTRRGRNIRRRNDANSLRRSNGEGLSNSLEAAATAATDASAALPPITNQRDRLVQYCSYLSSNHNEDPQLLAAVEHQPQPGQKWTDQDRLQLFILMTRAMGWRVRFVMAMQPMNCQQIRPDHPIFASSSYGATTTTMTPTMTTLRASASAGTNSMNNITMAALARSLGQNAVFMSLAAGPASGMGGKSSGNKKRKRRQKGRGDNANGTASVAASVAAATAAVVIDVDNPVVDTAGQRHHHHDHPQQQLSSSSSPPFLAWAEILCSDDRGITNGDKPSNTKKAAVKKQRRPQRWIHVDPTRHRINVPNEIEMLLYEREQQQQQDTSSSTGGDSNSMKKRKRRKTLAGSGKRKPVAYVLAVEHSEDRARWNDRSSTSDGSTVMTRWTDVTPRYAHSWIETLEQRGMTSANQKKRLSTKKAKTVGGGDHSGTTTPTDFHRLNDESWWTQTLKLLNVSSKTRPGHTELSTIDTTSSTNPTMSAATTGASATNAIELSDSDDDSDDLDRKPAALDLSQGRAMTGNKAIQGRATELPDNGNQKPAAFDNPSSENNRASAVASSRHTDQEDDDSASTEEAEDDETKELLMKCVDKEKIPTSKTAFKTHPVYAIASVLGSTEVIAPDASKRVCGVFKGELIYRRSDISTALVAKKWLYQGRKVREAELAKPIKRVKARKKPGAKKNQFKALSSYGVGETNDGSAAQRAQQIAQASLPEDDDGMNKLYAIWQTDPYRLPHVGPNDTIPVNEYNNVELQLLNPGLAHIDQRGVAKTAKRLGIPYAPCLLGFEGHGGNRTPTIRGIVVHEHNAQILREASIEVAHYAVEQEDAARRQRVLRNWKRLMVGLLTKERLEREYGT